MIFLPFNCSNFLKRFFPFFCYCLLVHIFLSPNSILILGFSLCNVNCAVSGLHEDESTDGWEWGLGGLAKTKNPGGLRNGKNPSNELTKVLVG